MLKRIESFTGSQLPSGEVSKQLQQTPAIIVCGGLGTRLKDVTGDSTSKPLVLISPSKTLIEAPVAQLEFWGVKQIILATSRPVVDDLQNVFTHNPIYTSRFRYSVEDDSLGVIGAVMQTIESNNLQDRQFILSHADEIIGNVNLRNMMRQHMQSHAGATLVTTNHPDAGNSYVGWTDHHGRITHVKRHPSPEERIGGSTMTGLFIFSPGVFQKIAEHAPDWDTLVQNAVRNNLLYGFETKGGFYNANTPGELERFRVLYRRNNLIAPLN